MKSHTRLFFLALPSTRAASVDFVAVLIRFASSALSTMVSAKYKIRAKQFGRCYNMLKANTAAATGSTSAASTPAAASLHGSGIRSTPS